ncbi:CG12935 [Drosophila busckii]|uniref:CG12935 n=1 Tax=Drosophila busckii TaxID=30019 RepID=A0A0M4EHZ9_DROBS|nr:transmembrane protein 223 [Drosophila busckii]ALC40630.1 CG12935 [Drosophila busckii]
MSNLLNFALRQGVNLFKRHTLQSFRLAVPVKLANFTPARTISATVPKRALDVNTNVTKDVVLFKYENPKFYKMLNVFGVCQFVFWTYLSHFAFTTLRDAPVAEKPGEELKWYQRINLGENKYKNGITACSFLIGYGILFAVWMFTLRSVRFLILRKGGQSVSFVTYGPFNRNRIITVPLKCISAEESRELARVQLPIKVKGKTLYYVLDMRGEFRNQQLFDHTAGLKRRI